MNIFHQTLSINYFQYEKTGPPPMGEVRSFLVVYHVVN